MKKMLLIIMLTLLSNTVFSYPKTPNLDIATGHLCTSIDKDFDGYRYPGHIAHCRRSVTTNRKNKICAKYGVKDRRNYTVDHIIPLSVGGSNSDWNLWCQHRAIYSANLEYWLYEQVKGDKMTQAEAVVYILGYKYNPTGKDHVPPVPGQVYSTYEQEGLFSLPGKPEFLQ